MRFSVSDTAEYGDYVTGPQLINAETRTTMKQILGAIRDGSFARRWIDENQKGRPEFEKMRKRDIHHPIEEVGRRLRRMMAFVHPKEVIPGQGGA